MLLRLQLGKQFLHLLTRIGENGKAISPAQFEAKLQGKWFRFQTGSLTRLHARYSMDKAQKRRMEGETSTEHILKSGLSLQLTNYCNDTPPSPNLNPGFQIQDRERMTCCPLETKQALSLNHLPVLHPSKVSLLGYVRKNLATHTGEEEDFPFPPSS